MQARRRIALGGIVGALLVAVLWLVTPRSSKQASEPAPRTPAGNETVSRPQTQASESPASVPAEEAPATPPAHSPLDQKARERLLHALQEARAGRLAQAAGAGSQPAAPASESAPLALANKTGSNSEWEKRQIDTLNQLLGECFDLARQEQPELAGSFGVRFTIAGEPEIGGVVDDVEIMEDYSTIAQATMRECATESLYALELDPPPEGVRVGREVTLRLGSD